MNYLINWSASTSLHNLVDLMNLRCAPSWSIGFLGSSYFVGGVLGNLFLSSYGDTKGRVKMIRIALSLSVIVYILVLFVSTSLYLNYFLLFIFGALSCLRVSTAYLYG